MKIPSFKQLQARGTLKWTRYPADVIPLWVAESDFETCPAVRERVQEAVTNEYFGYPGDDPGVVTAVADFYRDFYGYDANPRWIAPIPDVVRGVYLAIEHFTPAGSPVIIPTPTYPPFLALLTATGREGVFFDATNGMDLADIRKAFESGAKSMVVANPFNPVGYLLEEEFLHELVALADEFGARLFFDEIHAPLVLEGKHVVAAGLSDLAARVCITITATSKAWNTAGLKCAQLIFSNQDDWNTWSSLSPILKEGVSTIGLIAAEAAYRDGRDFLIEELDYLRDNRDYLVQRIPEAIPGAVVHVPQATYLMWVDVRNTAVGDLGQSPAQFFVDKAKVAFNDGSWFTATGDGFIRVNFATSRELLEEAFDRVEKAVVTLPTH